MHILIIEDDRDMGETLVDLLTDAGHLAVLASSATEAVALARELQPRLVFCDLQLGQAASGLDLARMLRADPATTGAVLIALTGADPARWMAPTLEAGFQRLLRKPVSIEVLEAVVRELE